jgi:hypothetical protein
VIAPVSPPAETILTPAMLGNSTAPAGASGSALAGLVDRAKGPAQRNLPGPAPWSLCYARHTLPLRIRQSRRYPALEAWTVWAIPRAGLDPPYSGAQSGFQPVHEPSTASVHGLDCPLIAKRMHHPYVRSTMIGRPSGHLGFTGCLLETCSRPCGWSVML